jgi:hypothetical protein
VVYLWTIRLYVEADRLTTDDDEKMCEVDMIMIESKPGAAHLMQLLVLVQAANLLPVSIASATSVTPGVYLESHLKTSSIT